jgi:demethylsterigmatocystin 6-O-methyltransferase
VARLFRFLSLWESIDICTDASDSFSIGGPVYQAFPDYLQEIKYQTQSPDGKLTWHKGMNTDLGFFPWAKQHPDKLKWFQQLMSVPRDGDWLDVAPFTAELLASVESDTPLFVDVGGSIGHQSARLRARFPNLPGRVIVQDLEETVKAAPAVTGVEFMAHNFFNPQPVKGMLGPP